MARIIHDMKVCMEMSGDEARALCKMLGTMSRLDYERFGLTSSQAGTIGEIFRVLDDVPGVKVSAQ